MRTSLIAAFCLTLAACSAEPQPTAPPSSSPAASPVSSPSASPSASPTPAYNTRLADCADGTCEVLLTGSQRLAPAKTFGIRRLTLVHVAPDRLEFTVNRTDGSKVTGYVGGTGYLSLASGPTITIERHDK